MEGRAKISERFRFGEPLDTLFEDFPRSEFWRLMSDGWQHQLGSHLFTSEFYWGLSQGLKVLNQFINEDPVTVEMICKLHDSAYQFEQDFKKNIFQGIRHHEGGQFSVFFSTREMPANSAISEEGFNEFVDAVIAAGILQQSAIEKEKFFTVWRLKQQTSYGKYYFACSHPSERESFKKILRQYFDALKIKHNERKDDSTIKIETTYVHRDNLKKAMAGFLDEFYREMNQLKEIKESDQAETHILTAIARLIRNLHQSHFFLDGNGRTNIFLLKNLLLAKYLKTFSITMTPAHFTGYSLRELVAEMRRDIQLFKEFKVTRAVEYLKGIKKVEDFDEYFKLKTGLMECLSSNPVIALGQISEIFSRYKEIKKAGSEAKMFTAAHDEVFALTMGMLKDLYYDTVCKLVDDSLKEPLKQEKYARLKKYENILTPDAFVSIVHQHEIFHDKVFSCGEFRSKEKDLEKLVVGQIRKYKYVKPDEYNRETEVFVNEYVHAKKSKKNL